MKIVIPKRPERKNLLRKSISLSESEFSTVNNPDIDSEIHVFDEDTNELVFLIKKSKYSKLTAIPKTRYVDGAPTNEKFYVIDLSKAV